MPSTYAHYVFGKEVYQRYPEDLKKIIAPYRPLYDIGLHGPDILFYYKALKKDPVNQVGYTMHSEPAWDFFSKASDVLRNTEEGENYNRKLAYVCGFLCHFALDSMCHGYVEKKIHVSGITHTEIEVEFDRYLLVRDVKDPQRQRLTDHIIPSFAHAEVIQEFFPDMTVKEIEKSLKGMILYHNILLAPNPLKRQFLYTMMRLIGKYRELQGLIIRSQPNPNCLDSNKGLTKRLEEAKPLCLNLTENFLGVVLEEQKPDPWFEKTFSFGPDWKDIKL